MAFRNRNSATKLKNSPSRYEAEFFHNCEVLTVVFVTSLVIRSAELSVAELGVWLREKVATYLNLPLEAVDVDVPLPEYGFDSTMSLSLCADLQREHDIEMDTTIVWDYPTITAMAAHLASDEAERGRAYAPTAPSC